MFLVTLLDMRAGHGAPVQGIHTGSGRDVKRTGVLGGIEGLGLRGLFSFFICYFSRLIILSPCRPDLFSTEHHCYGRDIGSGLLDTGREPRDFSLLFIPCRFWSI